MNNTVIELRAVTFRRNGRDILNGIDLTVRAGEHWALLGPNGAGKSTILGFCGAVTHPSSGTVDILGRRLGRVDLQHLRRDIGHVNPRHPLQSPLSATEVVLTGLMGSIETPMRWAPSPEQLRKAHSLLADVGLSPSRDASWFTLSQGERGRVLIARALISDPQLLLLDEPTTGLDVAAREQLLETLDTLADAAPKLASILVTHHLEELPETTTHALVISNGTAISSGPVESVLTSATISDAFEHPITVTRSHGRWSALAIRRAPVLSGN